MIDELHEMRREYDSAVIGPRLHTLIDRVVRATAPQYPAQDYSDAGVWNPEALEDARNDWIETRLLRRGDLQTLLLQATSVGHLRSALTTSFSQFLANRRPRSSAANLYRRTLEMLRMQDAVFARLASSSRSGEQLWTLTTDPREERSRLDLAVLVGRARELTDDDLEVVRYADETLRSSPILRAPMLERFVAYLLSLAEGALDTDTIARVMRARFGLYAFEPAEFEDVFAADEAPLPARVPIEIAARSVLMRLPQPTAHALVAVDAAGGDFGAAARTLATDVTDVYEAVSQALEMIATLAADSEEATGIYARLKELLHGE